MADKRGHRPKPDNREDNVDKLQEQVVNTIENLESTHDMLHNEDLPEKERERLLAKNERREHAIAGKREEIRDEYEYAQRQHRD